MCPHCHSRNFHLQDGKAICCLCGLEGEIHNAGGKYSFTFPAEQLEHAHDTLSGKFIHGNDIKENTGKKIANMQTEKYKARQGRVPRLYHRHRAREAEKEGSGCPWNFVPCAASSMWTSAERSTATAFSTGCTATIFRIPSLTSGPM